MVMSAGGMTPAVMAAMAAPSLMIYGDGRVLTAQPAPMGPPVPARYRVARVDPAEVRGFIAAAQAGGLFDGADFGSPRVTDLPTTTVLLDGGSGAQQIRVYALGALLDTGLSPEQRDNRDRLRELIEQAGALAGGAATEDFSPDRVLVAEPTPGRTPESAAAPWPGPPPSSFLAPATNRRFLACGELTGADARAVYQAALANPGGRWLVDGQTRVLGVNPLPVDGCG